MSGPVGAFPWLAAMPPFKGRIEEISKKVHFLQLARFFNDGKLYLFRWKAAGSFFEASSRITGYNRQTF